MTELTRIINMCDQLSRFFSHSNCLDTYFPRWRVHTSNLNISAERDYS